MTDRKKTTTTNHIRSATESPRASSSRAYSRQRCRARFSASAECPAFRPSRLISADSQRLSWSFRKSWSHSRAAFLLSCSLILSPFRLVKCSKERSVCAPFKTPLLTRLDRVASCRRDRSGLIKESALYTCGLCRVPLLRRDLRTFVCLAIAEISPAAIRVFVLRCIG